MGTTITATSCQSKKACSNIYYSKAFTGTFEFVEDTRTSTRWEVRVSDLPMEILEPRCDGDLEADSCEKRFVVSVHVKFELIVEEQVCPPVEFFFRCANCYFKMWNHKSILLGSE